MSEDQAQVATEQAVGGDAQSPAQEAPQLNISDLQQLRAIVDLACRRGAFGGAEASAVGSAFDRLNTFLDAVAPADQASTAE